MDGRAGGRTGFTSDLAWVDMGEWIKGPKYEGAVQEARWWSWLRDGPNLPPPLITIKYYLSHYF